MTGAVTLGVRRVGGFELFDLGDYPAAVPGDGELVAELYEMPHRCNWQALDDAEGVFDDPPLYRRELVEMADNQHRKHGGDGDHRDPLNAYLYIYARPLGNAARIASGDWLQRA